MHSLTWHAKYAKCLWGESGLGIEGHQINIRHCPGIGVPYLDGITVSQREKWPIYIEV